jgi:hypothetical protein
MRARVATSRASCPPPTTLSRYADAAPPTTTLPAVANGSLHHTSALTVAWLPAERRVPGETSDVSASF